jgi:hypothetical protein
MMVNSGKGFGRTMVSPIGALIIKEISENLMKKV